MTVPTQRTMSGRRRTVSQSLGAGYAVLILLATLLPTSSGYTSDALCIVCGPLGGVDVVQNLLLFMPLGVFLAMGGMRLSRAVAAMCLLTVIIEWLQLFVIAGRDASVGDLVMNSAGGLIGFTIGAHAGRLVRPSAGLAVKLILGWSALWLAMQAGAGYALTPALPQSRYFGQVAPELGGMARFSGPVIDPVIDDVPITYDRFDDSEGLRARLSRETGAWVSAAVVPRGQSAQIAPIVRIADDRSREILLLAQRRSDVVFGIRTGSVALRLRPVRFLARDALPAASPDSMTPDTIQLRARYARSQVLIRSGPDGNIRERRLVPRVSDGWRLIFPKQTYDDGRTRDALAAMVWIVGLVFPFGYWGVVAVRTPGSARHAWTVGARAGLVVGVLVVGLAGVPAAFALTPPAFWEWTSTFAGVAAGAAVAARSFSMPRRTRTGLESSGRDRFSEGASV